MRRIGASLMIAGLLSLLVSLLAQEAGGAVDAGAAHYLTLLFYLGAALCVAGALVFSARKLFGRP